MKRFKIVDEDSDMSYRIYVREFTGRITKLRWKILQRFIRTINRPVNHCHHIHDCCGCLHSQSAELIPGYNHSSISIMLRQSYNY